MKLLIDKHCILLMILFGILLNNQVHTQSFNDVDSLGLKQGNWIEYKVVPSEGTINKVFEDSTGNVVIKNEFNIRDKHFLFEQRGKYINGLRNGIWDEYWPNGNLRNEINYMNGIIIGDFTIYYSNGHKRMKGNINLKPIILIQQYNENGEFLQDDTVEVKEILKYLYFF